MKTFSQETFEKSLRAATEADLAIAADEDIAGCIDEGEIQVFEGDLDVDGHFYFGDLIVTGKMTVAGTLSSDETGTLIVGGDLVCQNLFMEGNLDVVGTAEIKEVAYGFYEAGITNIPNLKGNILILGNHSFEADYDSFKHPFVFSNFDTLKPDEEKKLKLLITDEAFEILSPLIGIGESDDDAYWHSAFLKNGILRS